MNRAGLRLGRYGAWFNPSHGDDARTSMVIAAEKLGYPMAPQAPP